MFKYIYKYKKTGEYKRPIIPVALKNQEKEVFYLALIDWGADSNILHYDLADILGIELSDASFPKISLQMVMA